MSNRGQWLFDLNGPEQGPAVDGVVFVKGFRKLGLRPEQYVVMEKAEHYRAQAVFFGPGSKGAAPEAFIYLSEGPAIDPDFGKLHQRLWSWGGVPLVFRRVCGLVQLFRCANKADFESSAGKIICNPFATLRQTAVIDAELKKAAWWDAEMLRNGTLWDDKEACKGLLSSRAIAHKVLVDEIKDLSARLDKDDILPKPLRRKLLILALLITYLEERKVLGAAEFAEHSPRASRFFEVLADGPGLVSLLESLETRFNGNVFRLEPADREQLKDSRQLTEFRRLIEARQEKGGQLTLWQRYSFEDLPVEVISHIYQLFVKDKDSSVYTPPFLVRLMLDEAMSWERLDKLGADKMEVKSPVVLDPSCGSGVFLVEAYKRLVIHWRLRNNWKRPTIPVLKNLVKKVRGVDLEHGAVELAAFSLCLALCDALQPEDIRHSVKLFPELMGKTIQQSCFFEAKDGGLIQEKAGIVVGNPPFESNFTTAGAKAASARYKKETGEDIPDKQLAYLFLHEAMECVGPGGVMSMLQQYNFLYNQQSRGFRRRFIARWDVREILDFISVRGLFQKGDADTKVVVVVAEAQEPPADRQILHATFRRTVRADAEQGFDIDYYDLHWMPRSLVLSNDGVWRCNLLGGGDLLGFVGRLRKMRTLGAFASKKQEADGWDFGEGFIVTKSPKAKPAPHLTGKPLIEPCHLDPAVSLRDLETIKAERIRWQYTEARFNAPMVLVHENEELAARFVPEGHYGYKDKIVGFCAPAAAKSEVMGIERWIRENRQALTCFTCAAGTTTFTQRSTWVGLNDILALPYPESRTLDLSPAERILVDDIVDFYRDLIRLGEDSRAMKKNGWDDLAAFNETFTGEINAIYRRKPLRVLPAQRWPGVICQPYIFGKGGVDWTGADELRDKLDGLLHEQRGSSLRLARIARIYDGHAVYVLKPDRLRYWLRSVALRDADETLADMEAQGF